MQYTPAEIVTEYRQAKDKKKQIQILSELNTCSKDTIVKILLENGISQKQLPRTRKNNSSTRAISQPKHAASITPKNAEDDIFKYIQALKDRRSQLKNEIDEIDSKLHDIMKTCEVIDD